MEKQEFKIAIDAPREKVWKVLWTDDSYQAWTKPFSEGSHAITDWQKGSKVLFLDGKGMGMVSTIDDAVPNQFMSFKHLGVVKDGIEDTESDEVKGWAGAHENYTLKDVQGKTELVVDLDMNEEYKDYFLTTFPIALQRVKELAEQ
ncbi:SRPBCC domain-containing protein [Niastella caeni]|uniref:SRPBCC domain-containing protein n=1 Tax=Niastella caeni TaxID=2569763 RepID=A0A4S8HVN3_9BACT|nr:SRPBCC domain-containing protein [Niastella caeni]THU39697.1 SRPBCC domain-containing protein [Niastella caeni]